MHRAIAQSLFESSLVSYTYLIFLHPLHSVCLVGLRAQKEKMFHLELTDEQDAFFLYFLDVGESDFHQLKKEQSILVEFPVFAENLIELILLCSKNVPQGSSHFSAHLDTTEERFSIVESNVFKQITHIALKLRRGNDAAIKDYLSSRLKYATSRGSCLEAELAKSESTLKILEQGSAELQRALDSIT